MISDCEANAACLSFYSGLSEHGPLSYSCVCTTDASGHTTCDIQPEREVSDHTSCVIQPGHRCECAFSTNLSSSLTTKPSCVSASAADTLCTSHTADPDLKQFMVRGTFKGFPVNVLMDSGATTSFINSDWCAQHDIPLETLAAKDVLSVRLGNNALERISKFTSGQVSTCFACIKSRATSDPRDSWDTDRDDYWTEVVGVEPRCARVKLGLDCRPTLYVDPGVHNFN